MNCLTKLSQKKRVTKNYIRAFLAIMISKRDSSDFFGYYIRFSSETINAEIDIIPTIAL